MKRILSTLVIHRNIPSCYHERQTAKWLGFYPNVVSVSSSPVVLCSLGSWILWAMIVTCSTFYLIWIGLRFKCAYHWPKQTGICRSWNERAHVNQDCSLLWDTDDMSTDPTTVPSNCVGSCQCLLVNQVSSSWWFVPGITNWFLFHIILHFSQKVSP